MKDPKVAAFAEKRGIPVHLLRRPAPNRDAEPKCGGDDAATYTLSSAARADVTCEACLVGEPDRKGCGRIDLHDDHPWRRDRVIRDGTLVPATDYWCPGTPIVEGGARAPLANVGAVWHGVDVNTHHP